MTISHHKLIKAPLPFSDRFVLFIAKLFGVIALLAIVVSIIYSFWIGWAFTTKLRELLDSTFWSILVYLIATVFMFVWGASVSKFAPRMTLGKPAFGELGGLPFQTFKAAIRARAQIKVDLHERDQRLARRFNIVQTRILHDMLKTRFEQINQDTETSSPEQWANIWNHEVLDMTFDGQSFRDAADINKLGLNYAINTLMRSTFLIPLISVLFWVAMLLILFLYVNQSLSQLVSIQICLMLVFVFAAFWNMLVLHNLSTFPLTFKGLEIPEATRDEFANEIEALEGAEIRPKNIKIKKGFYRVVRNYQLRLLSGAVISDISALLLLLGGSFGVMFIIDAEYTKTLIHYHEVLAYGIVIAAIGLVAGFYIFSIALQNLKNIVASVFVALLAAGLPFLIKYLLAGEVNITGLREAIFTGSGGLIVALVTSITSHVKESME